MSGYRRHRHPGERGGVLLLALVFLIVFGLLIGLLLQLVAVNMRTTDIVRNRAERTYAADAAVEYAIERLRLDPTVCTTETPSSLPSQTVNGRTATISCQVTAGGGTPLGALGWAAIITGDLDQQGGGSATFSGPSYVRGSISASLENINGSLYQYSPTCPGTLVKPAGLTVSPKPPYSWQCTTAPAPDPPHVLPPKPGAPKAPDTYSNCRVFYPGRYTSRPALLSNNYFVSGVYYFENIGKWSVANGVEIVGGFNPAESSALGLTPCRANADPTPGGGGSGYGVEWIFGGNSALAFGNNDKAELYSRVPGPTETGVTERISFYAVPVATGGYLASNVSGAVLDTSGGHPAVAIHGLFYGPKADLDLDGPNGTSVFHNGAVVHDVHLKISASVNSGPIFGVDTSPTNKRYVVITATSADPGRRSLISRSLVEIRNSTNPATVIVRSWRTR